MSSVRALIVGSIGALAFIAVAHAADPARSWRSAKPFDDSIMRGTSTYEGEPTPAPPRYVAASPVAYRWQGMYVGGQIGFAGAGYDFGNATASQINYILRNDIVGPHVANWTTLPTKDATKQIYGAFVGYNAQWDGDLILGAEANYSHTLSGGLFASASDSMTRTFQDDAVAPAQHHYFYTATVATSASARVVDYATARMRAGVVLDRLLPYAFAGIALGRVDVVRSTTISYTRQDIPDVTVPPNPPIAPQPVFNFGPQSQTERKDGVIAYGYAAGVGIDVALLPNVFMRAEYEYVKFSSVHDIKLNVSTGRLGVGLKF